MIHSKILEQTKEFSCTKTKQIIPTFFSHSTARLVRIPFCYHNHNNKLSVENQRQIKNHCLNTNIFTLFDWKVTGRHHKKLTIAAWIQIFSLFSSKRSPDVTTSICFRSVTSTNLKHEHLTKTQVSKWHDIYIGKIEIK